MHFEVLKIFCDVIDEEGFSGAAAANNRTQSAVSQMIDHLEKRLHVRLLDRTRRPVRLTDQGQRFYNGCKPLVKQYQELEAWIKQTAEEQALSVHVAAIYSVGLGDMDQFVERFKAENPNAQVQMDYLHPDRVYEKVLNGTADFGLVSFPRRMRELHVMPWREEEMVLACSPEHRLARNLFVAPTELGGEKYIGFDKGLVIRREVDRFLRDQGVAVQVAHEFDSIENIKPAVESALGVALLPEPTLRREVKDRRLAAVPLLGCRFVRPLGIIRRRHHALSSTALRFLTLLRESEGTGSPPDSGDGKHTNGGRRRHRGRNGASLDKLRNAK